MAYITLDSEKLKSNYAHLDRHFKQRGIKWAIVTKMLAGNRAFLREVLSLGATQIADSRVISLKVIRELAPRIETIYIKPPEKHCVDAVMDYADISMCTELETARLLSASACRKKKQHKVIIMIELGEIREGLEEKDLIDFYEEVSAMKNLEVVGIGTNLTCFSGVLPAHDNLVRLGHSEQLIKDTFNCNLPYVSGGSSVTIPLIHMKQLPECINHFRVGDSLFLGSDVYNNSILPHMESGAFRLYAQIIELKEKPLVPWGELSLNWEGKVKEFNAEDRGKRSMRALVDLGKLDVDQKHLFPADRTIHLVGACSDMMVVDLGSNKEGYAVGDLLEFELDYLGTTMCMYSRDIKKKVI